MLPESALMSSSKCSPSREHKLPLCLYSVEGNGDSSLLSHTTRCLWGSHEHTITAGMGNSCVHFSSPWALGPSRTDQKELSSDLHSGSAFINAALDAELARPLTPLLKSRPCTALMNSPITAREIGTQGARAWLDLTAEEGLLSLLNPRQPKAGHQLLPHHNQAAPIPGVLCPPQTIQSHWKKGRMVRQAMVVQIMAPQRCS